MSSYHWSSHCSYSSHVPTSAASIHSTTDADPSALVSRSDDSLTRSIGTVSATHATTPPANISAPWRGETRNRPRTTPTMKKPTHTTSAYSSNKAYIRVSTNQPCTP